MVDVDDFKNINDTYGHSVGDQVLISISHTLKSKLKKGEIIGRLGGEEFLLLLKDSNLKSASKLAEELRKEIERFNIDTINKPITISLGIYQTQDGDSIDDVLVEVDKCLYKAKNLGKNIVYNTEKKD